MLLITYTIIVYYSSVYYIWRLTTQKCLYQINYQNPKTVTITLLFITKKISRLKLLDFFTVWYLMLMIQVNQKGAQYIPIWDVLCTFYVR